MMNKNHFEHTHQENKFKNKNRNLLQNLIFKRHDQLKTLQIKNNLNTTNILLFRIIKRELKKNTQKNNKH